MRPFGSPAFFRRTLGTILGSKRMENARFEQFGGRFELVGHNKNPFKTYTYIVNKLKYYTTH